MIISRRKFIRNSGMVIGAVSASKYISACASDEKVAIATGSEKGAVVKTVNGIPELFINGEKTSRMWGRLALPMDYGPEKLDMYEPAGIKVYMTALDTAISLCWDGEDEFYFDKYEAHIRRLVEKKPDIQLILYVGATGGSPYKWCKANEDELTLYDSGKRIEAASIASEKWKNDSSRAFREFVKYFKGDSRFKDNIIGFNPVYNANEWFSHHRKSRDEFGWADFSTPMLKLFRNWVKQRYNNDVSALRESWNDRNVSFETVEIPSAEERLMANDPNFFYTCTSLGNKVADYYICYDEALANLGVHWCKTIKESSPENVLAGMMFAYSYCGRHDAKVYPHNHGHGMAMNAIRSEFVDFLHSPYHYYNRSVDGTHYSQHAPDTVMNNGVLFIDQIDSKPHLRKSSQNASTPWESQQLIKRDVAYSLTKNAYCYWLEGGPGPMFPIVRHSPEEWGRLWYDDPEILATIGKLKELTDQNDKENNSSVTEMALITSNEGLYQRRLELVHGNLYIEAVRQWFLPEIGLPFDDYIMEDFANIKKKYKLYLFVNPHYVPSELRKAIQEKLKAEGATAIWLYGPGYLNEKGCELSNSRELTGISLSKSDKKAFIQVEITDYNHPYTNGLEKGTSFGSDISPEFFKKDLRWMSWPENIEDYKFSPVFHVEDKGARVLGKLRESGKPGLAVKNVDGFTSVYCSAPLLNADLIRNIAKEAGVHVYSENHDLIYANSGYVSVTAADEGNTRIYFPESTRVSDALTGEVLTAKGNSIEYSSKQYETRIFKLG